MIKRKKEGKNNKLIKLFTFLSTIKNYKVFYTLRFKLVISFVVPIIFIIGLGWISSRSASNSIISNYEDSTSQAIDIASNYLNFGLESVDATAKQYSNDDSITKYFMNYYVGDVVAASEKATSIQNALNAKKKTDDFIGEIYLLSENVKSITSSTYFTDNDDYTKLIETNIGAVIKKNTGKTVWSSSNPILDEMLGSKPEDYSLRLIRNITSSKAIIIVDIESETVNDIISNLHFDKSGIIGIVTADGKEMLSGNDELRNDIKFSKEAIYKSAVSGELSNGSDYVDIQGEKYLFMYSKIGDTGAMICALIPSKTITAKADNIKNITLVVVLVASIIAVFIGMAISINIDQFIKSIIAKFKQAADGDLTVEFNSKRKDEFQILTNEVHHTFQNMKRLILQVKELGSEVSGSSNKVSETSAIFMKSSQDISFAMNEVEQGVMQQAKDAEECLSQMDNLSNKIVLVSDNTKEIRRIAEGTKINITQGTVATEELNIQTKETISSLHGKSQREIGLYMYSICREILDIIAAISIRWTKNPAKF